MKTSDKILGKLNRAELPNFDELNEWLEDVCNLENNQKENGSAIDPVWAQQRIVELESQVNNQ